MERNDGEKITMQFVERMAKMEEKLDMLVRMLPEITALQNLSGYRINRKGGVK